MDEYTKKLLLKAKTYFKQKEYKKASIHYDKILKLDSRSIEALSMKGQIFFENKDYENAIKYFNKALKINPKQSKTLLFKSKSLFHLEKYLDSFTYYNKAIEIDKSLEDKKFFNDVNEIVQNQKLNEKYIIFKDKYYIVKKDTEEFGSFILLENAITLRNLLMENKWDTEKIPDDYLTDYSLASHDRIFYIRKYKDKYVLSKVINNELEYFGTYDTKEEAVAQRTYLINHNWQMIQENNEKIDEHVYQVGDECLVINQNEIYARFQDISEAIRFRNYCIKMNWKI